MIPSKDHIPFRIPRAEFLAFGKALRVGGILLGDVTLEFTRDSLTIECEKGGTTMRCEGELCGRMLMREKSFLRLVSSHTRDGSKSEWITGFADLKLRELSLSKAGVKFLAMLPPRET